MWLNERQGRREEGAEEREVEEEIEDGDNGRRGKQKPLESNKNVKRERRKEVRK